MADGYILPIRDCAKILGMTPDRLRARGYNPVKRGEYDIAEIVANELKLAKGTNRRESMESEQVLLLQERRKRIATQNAERSAELIHVDTVVALTSDHINSAKKKLLTLGVSVSHSLAGETDPKKIADIITREIKSGLEELSFDVRRTVVTEALRRMGRRMATAAEPDSESVGRAKARPKSRIRNRTG